MATIHIDGKQYEVDGSDNLLQACLSLGIDVPYFCWHPALGSVGACRQCAVKQYANADDKRGRLVMSCMTPATNGAVISVTDNEAKEFRASVVEWLMTNHPHDCPVCEEGGHCHLQDMTVMTGHNVRHYRFEKRTHQNQDLGPFINHEMNRCIACYRCVRYYKDYAGGTDLGVYGAHDNVYFGRAADGTLESEFSGNLTEICPTGVFTDKTHSARYNRKWDMQFAPSICQQCSVGCNTSPGERYGELRRIENRYNGSVNHYFLCDRGRFGYGYVNAKDRPRQPLLRRDGRLTAVDVDTAVAAAGDALRNARRTVGIGSPRASLEANAALRALVGAGNFSIGVNAEELALLRRARDILATGGVRTPSLRDTEQFDAVLVLGEDVTQTAPRIALALRQAAKNKAKAEAAARKVFEWQAEAIQNIGQRDLSPVFIAAVDATRLDDIAAETRRAAPEDLARLGFAVAHAIDAGAPAVTGLDAETAALAQRIAAALLAAKKPLVVSGTGLASNALLDAALAVARALQAKGRTETGLSLVVPEVNSMGLALIDATAGSQPLDALLTALSRAEADAVIVLENDLYRRAPAAAVDAALAAARTVIVVDHQRTATVEKAHIVLSAASFAEGDGTVVNNEGRAQRFYQVYDPVYYRPDERIHESWRWLHAVDCARNGKTVDWTSLDDAAHACASQVPALARIVDVAPEATFRIAGLKIAREPRRYSGRTAMRANLSVHEPRAPQDGDSPLTFSMEGYVGPMEPGPLTPFAWSPGWNSPQAWNKFQDEVGGHLKGGDGGVCLFDGATASFRGDAAPAAFVARHDALRAVALHHIFGSDELSVRAEGIASQTPAAYVALSAGDAARLQIVDGDAVRINGSGITRVLPVRVHAALAAGLLGVPAGIAGLPPADGTLWLTVTRAEAA
ncbi:MAG: NADH-quinone oxidoreductase subunit NuoG [Pseudomonadota bacterium]